MGALRGKKIVFGITGGIAAYKAADLVRALIKEKAVVTCVMTEAATRFVTPLTFEALSGRPCRTSMWETDERAGIMHTELSSWADAIMVAPATADFIGRVSAGLADDLLSAVIMASHSPVLMAPAMNVRMFENPIVQRNIDYLKRIGRYTFVTPDVGELACGDVGTGRLPDKEVLLGELERTLISGDMEGMRVLVTAGPTRESVDPVRFITNRSSGKMGFALAHAAYKRGAEVTLVAGPTTVDPPAGPYTIRVESAAEMLDAVSMNLQKMDLLIMAAAVADFRPESVPEDKIKKTGGEPLTLKLVPTDDVLKKVKGKKQGCTILGFAAETTDHIKHGRDKLLKKGMDYIFVNDVSQDDRGFGVDTNAGWLLSPFGGQEEFPPLSKTDLGHMILDRIVGDIQKKPQKKEDNPFLSL